MAWKPSENARTSLSAIVSQLEALDGRDRGFVLSRLNALYLAKQGKAKKPVKAPAKQKSSWKATWEKTPEYFEWVSLRDKLIQKKKDAGSSYVQDEDDSQALTKAQNHAFRVKHELQGKAELSSGIQSPENLGKNKANSSGGNRSEEIKEREKPETGDSQSPQPNTSGRGGKGSGKSATHSQPAKPAPALQQNAGEAGKR
jgi:hypothetical protein